MWDAVIIGGGASGLMCAMRACERTRRVLVVDHANRLGKKILMSGGGRCNFTNLKAASVHYLSENRHFSKSALSQYSSHDFLSFVQSQQVAYVEKDKGQLFCRDKAKALLNALLSKSEALGVQFSLNTSVVNIEKTAEHFSLTLKQADNTWTVQTAAVVVATGGLSIPTMGATGKGYEIARQFGLPVRPTRAALVPLTLSGEDLKRCHDLSGVSVPQATVRCGKQAFKGDVLLTHRGLSGPAILQISSYWQPGQTIEIDFCPEVSLFDALLSAKANQEKRQPNTWLMQYLPKRLINTWLSNDYNQPIVTLSHQACQDIAQKFNAWTVLPTGTEGYRTAEVTLGGVSTAALSSKTFETKTVPDLYFIGEVLDVTGWLGGYNFQWAWSSGWAAGNAL